MTVVAEPLPTPGHGGIQRTEPSRPVAQEIQSWLPEAEVILFGSRATGTWRPRSDINLAPIGISPDTDVMHTRIKRMRLLRLPTRTDRHTSRSLSLPGLILRRPALPFRTLPGTVRGPTPTGEQPPAISQGNPWPRVQLQAAQSCLMRSLRAVGTGAPADVLFHVQEALESRGPQRHRYSPGRRSRAAGWCTGRTSAVGSADGYAITARHHRLSRSFRVLEPVDSIQV